MCIPALFSLGKEVYSEVIPPRLYPTFLTFLRLIFPLSSLCGTVHPCAEVLSVAGLSALNRENREAGVTPGKREAGITTGEREAHINQGEREAHINQGEREAGGRTINHGVQEGGLLTTGCREYTLLHTGVQGVHTVTHRGAGEVSTHHGMQERCLPTMGSTQVRDTHHGKHTGERYPP